MTDIPTITFQCIGCDHSEEIELERIGHTDLRYKYTAWVVPDPYKADWYRNKDGQLVCQTCQLASDEPPDMTESLSAEERNPGLVGRPD